MTREQAIKGAALIEEIDSWVSCANDIDADRSIVIHAEDPMFDDAKKLIYDHIEKLKQQLKNL